MKRLHAMTEDELADVDTQLRLQPVEPVLRLWEDLRAVGDMPEIKPEHVRAMAWAIHQARREPEPR
ncbi:MAG: hypothetical protein ACOYLQ_15350 [Hyphomicrobiaceae bacterium]